MSIKDSILSKAPEQVCGLFLSRLATRCGKACQEHRPALPDYGVYSPESCGMRWLLWRRAEDCEVPVCVAKGILCDGVADISAFRDPPFSPTLLHAPYAYKTY